MVVTFKKPEEALGRYFSWYFRGLKTGLLTSITGGPFQKVGNGKSYTSAKIGEICDPDFSIDKVVYSPLEFLQVMDRVEESGKIGQVVVIDEGEITAPATMYHSFTNKAIFYNMATFRYLRAMSIFVTPSFSWIDKRIRTLVSHWGWTEKTATARKVEVFLHLYAIKTDLFGDRIFTKKIRLYDSLNKRLVIFKRFNVGLPTPEFCEAYEKKSMEFKKNLRKRLVPEIQKWEAYQLREEHRPPEEIVKEIANDPDLIKSLRSPRNKLDADLLQQKFPRLSTRELRTVKKLVEKMWSGR